MVTNVATIDTALVDAGVSTKGVGAAGYDGTLTGSDSANVMVGPYLPLADIDVTSTITDITAPIVAGQPYSFTVEVSNNGPAMAEGLTVHDLIQGIPGVQVTNILTAPNWFCSGDLTCTRQNPMTVTTETVATVTVIIPANTPAGAYQPPAGSHGRQPGCQPGQ